MPEYAEALTVTVASPLPLLGEHVTQESAALMVHEVLDLMVKVSPVPLEETKTEEASMLSLTGSPLCVTLTVCLELPYVKVMMPLRVEAVLFLATVTVSV